AAARPLLRLVVAREVRADHLPRLALVRRAEEVVARGVERVRLVRREEDGIAPLEAVLHAFRAPAHRVFGPDVDGAELLRAVVVARQVSAVGAGEDDVRVAGLRRDPARLAAANVEPGVAADAEALGARRDLDRRVV